MSGFPKDTLAYHASRRLVTLHDMSHVPVGDVAKRMQGYIQNAGDAVPEQEALWFYLMNHGMAELQKDKAPCEPLGEDLGFVDAYFAKSTESAIRAFFYLMMICTREARHVGSKAYVAKNIGEQFGPGCGDFLKKLSGNSSSAYQQLMTAPPDATLGHYVASLRSVFYEGSFSSGYGGPAWGRVTDCLYEFVTGRYTAEMMLDTVWTLAHNNGPIFNKGYHYTSHSGYLLQLLDIQRSGQIPEAVLTAGECSLSVFVDGSLVTMAEWIRDRFPGVVGPYVDWYKVELLGAEHKYPHQKKMQSTKYGLSGYAKDFEAKKAKQEQQKLEAKKKAEAEKLASQFEIMPGVFLKKVSRKKAA